MSKPVNQLRYLNIDRSTLNKDEMDSKDIKALELKMQALLKNKISGLSFSPYMEGQDPSVKSEISEQQIADRLEVIRPYTHWIRTFSTTLGNQEVPRIAHEKSIKTLVGAWINDDLENNEKEIENLIKIAKAGHADLIAVGNEVLLREDLEIEVLIAYINRVKQAVPDVPVGYVDAYYMFINYPEIVDVCDVIFANCYPFWEYCELDISIDYMKHMYKFVKRNAKGKPVVISETGWPTSGESYGGAKPSYENAMHYFTKTYEWANQENIHLFYFSSFDEAWKVTDEGEYGANWGLWDKDGKFKFGKLNK